MENNYQFHPETNEDFKKSVKWHENNRKHSGKEFAEEVLERIDTITRNPENHSQDEDGIRWTSLSKFPYHIYYLFKAPIVWILAIWHTSREPDDGEIGKTMLNIDLSK